MGFLISLKFLTILPLPWHREASPREIGQAVVYFPVVGLLLGFILVGLDKLFGLALPLSVANVLLIIFAIVLTGALHLDGFIDTCDGALVRSSPQERLRIMSDSHVGSFGVIGAVCLILLRYVALGTVPEHLRSSALVIMPMLGRWTMVYAIGAFPYAREQGTGRVFKDQASRQRVAIATVAAVVLSALLAGWSGLSLMAAVWLIILGIAWFLRLRLGGLSGDTYGAINELSEILALILLPLLADAVTTHFVGPWHIFDFHL